MASGRTRHRADPRPPFYSNRSGRQNHRAIGI